MDNLTHNSTFIPQWKAVLFLLCSQLGFCSLAFGFEWIFELQTIWAINGGIIVGLFLGAHGYGCFWERKKPSLLQFHYSQLSFFAALTYAALAVVYWTFVLLPGSFNNLPPSAGKIFLSALFYIPITVVFAFAITRLGLATGIMLTQWLSQRVNGISKPER